MDSEKISQGKDAVEQGPGSRASVRLTATASTRRRLLKASAAAPLAATLMPNAAFALSSAVQCAKADNDYQRVQPDLDADKAVRRPVMMYRKKNGKDGPDRLFKVGGEMYRSNGNMHDISNRRLRNRYRQGEERYVLEYFDVDQEGVIGQGPFPGKSFQGYTTSPEATPLSMSCYASINPQA